MFTPASAELPPAAPAPRAKGLLVAATLCGLGGIALAAGACWSFIVESGRNNPMAGTVVFVYPFAALYCVAGYLLYKPHRAGGWLAMTTCALVAGLQFMRIDSSSATWLSPIVVGNLAVILLVILNWRHLRPSRQVGA